MKAFVKHISYYLPKKIITNEDLIAKFPEWGIEKTASSVGIKRRHVSANGETALDLGIRAAEKLFSEYCIEKNSIDFLLFCTQSPDYFLPTSACVMHNKLGLKTLCGALDITLGCSGYVYGLALAKAMIFGKLSTNILFVTADTITKYLHPNDHNHVLFGDGAAATLISTNGFAEIGDFILGTDGRGAENLIVKTGAMRQRVPANDCHTDEKGNLKSSDHLFMDGEEIFNFTVDAIPPLIENTIKKNGLVQNDISLYIFHQANRYMLNYIRKLIRIDKEKFFISIEKTGNTTSSSIPVAIVEAQKENVLKGNVLLVGFGIGYSLGGIVIKVVI